MTAATVAPSPWALARQQWDIAADFTRGFGDGWWSGMDHVMRRWSAWWQEAATAPAAALTLPWSVAAHRLSFWQEVWRRETPAWTTPNRVALERPFARLRDFSDGATVGVPVLLMPPQAGHASTIVDYSERQSQVQTLRRAGLPRVYVAEWLPATPATRDTGIDDYLTFMHDAIAEIGGPVHLIGDCQGGWQSAIYTALFPEDVRTLTLAGAPIDFQAGDGAIKKYVNLLTGLGGMSFYQTLVAANGGVLPGWAMSRAFFLINPEQDFERYAALYDQLSDPAFLERHQSFETWFSHAQDIPGRFYLWIVENLFWQNRLVEGTLTALGRRVDLAAITQPLALLAGSRDHITPAAQVFGILPYVRTPRECVLELTADGGHLGLFMGSAPLANEWPVVAAHLRQWE
jgi:poly(3-hydroxyalkanoate) synthetase